MTDCESYQVELEMRGHGALEGARQAALEAHLAGCAACRSYEALVRRTEETMEAQARTLDFTALDARVKALHLRFRNRLWVPFVALPVAGALLGLITGELLLVMETMVGFMVLFAAVLLGRYVWEGRAIARWERARPELLDLYRRLLKSHVRRVRLLLVCAPLCMLGSVVQWHSGGWPGKMHRPLALALVLGGQALAFVYGVWLRLRQVPRWERELEDLGDR